MSQRGRVRSLTLALALSSVAVVVHPQAQSPVMTAALTQPVPVDPAIALGKLPNGVSYYVRANAKPEKRAELRLVVKAGSVLEDDDQQGLAHFVEHMAFNGTANFPKNDVVAFIESLGMRFGADVNAYTSFDETVYMLQVPTDKPEVMDRALLILEDWAHRVTFDPVEIDKERGVVMEEWRLRRGAGARMQDQIFPILLKGSRYADRIPIGKTEIIQGFKPERLKQFYTDWYRPDLMAVVAVGDFDPAAVQGLIKTHFSGIPTPPNKRPRPTYTVPDHQGTIYAISADKETTSASVEVDRLLPAEPDGLVGAYRDKIVQRLFTGIVSARLAEIAQKPNPPFVFAGVGRGLFLARSKEEASLFAQVKEDGIERGLDAILSEAERAARFGVTSTELDRQKQNLLRNYERLIAEKNNRVSSSRADEYIRNFLTGETLPTIDDEYAMHQRFLPQITVNDVNALAKDWVGENNRLVVVTAPQKPGLVVPDDTKLASVMKTTLAKPLTAYVDTVATSTLLDATPRAGAVVKTTTNDAAGITEWELANGVHVVLKPTTFKDDEILFRAASPGGTSLADDDDYVPATTAAQVLSAGGLAKFNAIDLRKVLTGKVASATPFMGELEEGVSGSSSKKDLETMFQLIYMRFTEPRADATAFGVQTSQLKTILANQTASPDFAFAQALLSARFQDHPRRQPLTAATVDRMNLDKSLAFYKDRFADASNFTFIFVGSFDLPTIKPLVEEYLGSLPSLHRKETWKDVGVHNAEGVVTRKVEKGIDPKSQAAIVFTGPFEYTQTQRVAIRAMSEILQGQLLEVIREELGGTYGISASASYQKVPRSEYSLTIQFGCDPQRTDALITRVFDEIAKFQANGPTPKQVADETAALQRDFETNIKVNNFLLSQLAVKYQYGEDPATLWSVPDYYKKIDAAMIQQAAKTYLNPKNYVQVTLFPEKK